jgi:hypothetical protein
MSALPANYLEWREGLTSAAVHFHKQDWELASAANLTNSVLIDGQKSTYVGQARSYARTLSKYMPHLEDMEGEPVEFARIEHFLTIGQSNEDLLCVDPSNKFSVWVFSPGEGGLLEKVAKTIDAFMKKAKPSKA